MHWHLSGKGYVPWCPINNLYCSIALSRVFTYLSVNRNTD